MAGYKTYQNAFDWLALLFQNIADANIGNAGGLQPSGVAGSLFISLHTADPTAGGSQTSSEVAFAAYARQGVVRSSSGWTVTLGTSGPAPSNAKNAATITFPAYDSGAGAAAITWIGIGTLVSGAGKLLYGVPVTNPSAGIRMNTIGDQAIFAVGTLVVNEQ